MRRITPLLYGGTGLGKTHLLHAVGNAIVDNNPNAKVVYMHSERFGQDMVNALQNNAIEEFKRYYRSMDALLIDDIQFFANKERSQEEFFHTFNALLEGNQQIILTSDRYPKRSVVQKIVSNRVLAGLNGSDRAAGARNPKRDLDEKLGITKFICRMKWLSILLNACALTCVSWKAH